MSPDAQPASVETALVDPAFVEPAYAARSLGDVVPSVAAALGCPIPGVPAPIALPEAPAYVVFLVDGLGANLLHRHAEDAPFLAELLEHCEPGTAGVPSTTAVSLTSLGTGLTPGGHGMVGYTARIPGTEHLLNALQWPKDVDPLAWQPHETAFTALRAAGGQVTVVNKREFVGSGLTVAAHRGAEYVGADRVGERIAGAVAASRERRSLTYLYDGDLDWTGHKHGVASAAWLQQLTMIDAEAEQLREALPSSTRLLVVADHGMVDCPDAGRTDVDDHPELSDGLLLFGGEARFRHLYCRTGATADVVAAWTARMDGRADVLTREDAVARGWFGPVAPEVMPRLGDVIVASRGDHAVVSAKHFPYEKKLVGLHGSLTPDEMLIPLLLS